MPVIVLMLLVLSFTVHAGDESFPGIKKLMTEQEYNASGLQKLTRLERDALNQWLIYYTIDDGPVIRRTNAEVKKAEESIQVVSRIMPPFRGWTGNALFHLENGQIWRQRLEGRYVHTADSTEVIISKNFFGFYKLTVTATDKSVGVSRVR